MRLSLVCGGIGVQGMAHIGALKELSRLGLDPDCISCSGMSGLVAALYVCGADMDELGTICNGLAEPREPFWIRRRRTSTDRLLDYVQSTVGDQLIEELPRRLHLFAFDATACKLISIDNGPLLSALRATTALPGFFSPGVDARGHVIVASSVFASVPTFPRAECTVLVAPTSGTSRRKWFRGIGPNGERAIETVARLRTEKRSNVDLIVQPVLPGIRPFAFDRTNECIEAGVRAVQALEERILMEVEDRISDVGRSFVGTSS